MTWNEVEYGKAGEQRLVLDAAAPEGPGPFPAVILVHGGGWVAGDRRLNFDPLFEPLTAAGIAWFTISYRFATEMALFGAAIDDVEQAFRFVAGHAARFRIDPRRIALVGESAGGQLAAMAALRLDPGAVRAVVALYAPCDLEELAKSSPLVPAPVRAASGTPWAALLLARLRELSPIRHVHSSMPPFLFVHGDADPLVPYQQSLAMCRAMRAANAQADLIAVRGGAHGIRRWEAAGLVSYKRMLTDWLARKLQ